MKTLGNHGLAYLLTKGAAMTTGSLTKGVWYYVITKAAASSLPVRAGLPFVATGATALVDGDKVIPLTKSLLGFARGKNLSQSKNVIDATTDSDNGVAYQLTDGMVTTSGSISGNNEIPAAGSAQEKIMTMFQKVMRNNVPVEKEEDVVLLMIDWTARLMSADGPKNGDPAEIDILPVVVTSKNTDGDYGGVKGFNIDFTGTSKDKDGCEPAHWVGKYVI